MLLKPAAKPNQPSQLSKFPKPLIPKPQTLTQQLTQPRRPSISYQMRTPQQPLSSSGSWTDPRDSAPKAADPRSPATETRTESSPALPIIYAPIAQVPAPAQQTKDLRAPDTDATANPVEKPPVPPTALAKDAPDNSVNIVDGTLEIWGQYAFSTLNVTDKTTLAQAQLQLSHDVTVGVRDVQRWTGVFSGFAEASLRAVDFQPSTNPNKTLENTSHVLPKFLVGFETDFGQHVSVRYSLGMENSLALHGLDTAIISVDSVAQPIANIEFTALLFTLPRSKIFLLAGATYLKGASVSGYSINGGYALDGGLVYRQNLGKERFLDFGFLFRDREQSTSLFGFSEQEAGFNLQFVMPLPSI